MRFLTEEQIREIAAEVMAGEIADKASALQSVARSAGLVLEVRNIADEFGLVIVRPRDPHAMAKRLAVPA